MYRRACTDVDVKTFVRFRPCLSQIFLLGRISSSTHWRRAPVVNKVFYLFYRVRRRHVFCWEVSSYECQSLRKCIEVFFLFLFFLFLYDETMCCIWIYCVHISRSERRLWLWEGKSAICSGSKTDCLGFSTRRDKNRLPLGMIVQDDHIFRMRLNSPPIKV